MSDQMILVELDALIDTRLATIYQISPSATRAIMMDGQYWLRETDDFSKLLEGFDQSSYLEAYSKRDKNTLKIGRLTNVMVLLGKVLGDIVEDLSNIPEVNRVGVDLNIYPYQLTEEESHLIKLALRSYLGEFPDINIVNIPYKELTLANINQNWGMVILYNFMEWFGTQIDLLKDPRNRAPSVTMILPLIYANPDNTPGEEDFFDSEKGKLHPAQVAEMFLAEFVGLTFMDTMTFSLPPPVDIEHPNAPK